MQAQGKTKQSNLLLLRELGLASDAANLRSIEVSGTSTHQYMTPLGSLPIVIPLAHQQAPNAQPRSLDTVPLLTAVSKQRGGNTKSASPKRHPPNDSTVPCRNEQGRTAGSTVRSQPPNLTVPCRNEQGRTAGSTVRSQPPNQHSLTSVNQHRTLRPQANVSQLHRVSTDNCNQQRPLAEAAQLPTPPTTTARSHQHLIKSLHPGFEIVEIIDDADLPTDLPQNVHRGMPINPVHTSITFQSSPSQRTIQHIKPRQHKHPTHPRDHGEQKPLSHPENQQRLCQIGQAMQDQGKQPHLLLLRELGWASNADHKRSIEVLGPSAHQNPAAHQQAPNSQPSYLATVLLSSAVPQQCGGNTMPASPKHHTQNEYVPCNNERGRTAASTVRSQPPNQHSLTSVNQHGTLRPQANVSQVHRSLESCRSSSAKTSPNEGQYESLNHKEKTVSTENNNQQMPQTTTTRKQLQKVLDSLLIELVHEGLQPQQIHAANPNHSLSRSAPQHQQSSSVTTCRKRPHSPSQGLKASHMTVLNTQPEKRPRKTDNSKDSATIINSPHQQTHASDKVCPKDSEPSSQLEGPPISAGQTLLISRNQQQRPAASFHCVTASSSSTSSVSPTLQLQPFPMSAPSASVTQQMITPIEASATVTRDSFLEKPPAAVITQQQKLPAQSSTTARLQKPRSSTGTVQSVTSQQSTLLSESSVIKLTLNTRGPIQTSSASKSAATTLQHTLAALWTTATKGSRPTPSTPASALVENPSLNTAKTNPAMERVKSSASSSVENSQQSLISNSLTATTNHHVKSSESAAPNGQHQHGTVSSYPGQKAGLTDALQRLEPHRFGRMLTENGKVPVRLGGKRQVEPFYMLACSVVQSSRRLCAGGTLAAQFRHAARTPFSNVDTAAFFQQCTKGHAVLVCTRQTCRSITIDSSEAKSILQKKIDHDAVQTLKTAQLGNDVVGESKFFRHGASQVPHPQKSLKSEVNLLILAQPNLQTRLLEERKHTGPKNNAQSGILNLLTSDTQLERDFSDCLVSQSLSLQKQLKKSISSGDSYRATFDQRFSRGVSSIITPQDGPQQSMEVNTLGNVTSGKFSSDGAPLHNGSQQPKPNETETKEIPKRFSSAKLNSCISSLDADQEDILEHWNNKCLIINAGPGAGKTFVLCELIQKIFNEQKDARVLVLAFNRFAVAELKFRLSRAYLSVPMFSDEDKDRAFYSTQSGCLVSTFHAFAFKSSGKIAYFKDKTFDPEFEDNVRLLKSSNCAARTWDWVIVDEAQDVNKARGEMIATLQETCQHLVLAGDPRQSMHDNTSWFADLWREKSAQDDKKTLRYNHRSSPQIIEFLNLYSAKNFSASGLHMNQLLPKEQSDTQSRSVFNIIEKHREQSHGYIIAHRLLAASTPEKTYAIAPVTIEKYKIGDITNDIENNIYINGGKTQKIKSLNVSHSAAAVQKGKKKKRILPYQIGTVSSLKGTERDTVVVYGVSRSYSPKVTTDLLARRIYVAMSRARERLHVITHSKLRNDNPLTQIDERMSTSETSGWECKLTVTDLAKERCTFWPFKHGFVPYFGKDFSGKQRQSGIISNDDEQFVGEYMERVLAYCLGFKNVEPEVSADDKDIIEQFHKDMPINPCFAVVRARRSKRDETLYLTNDHLLTGWEVHKHHCQPFANFIRGRFGGSCTYQKELEMPVKAHRSSKQVGVLRGRADFAGATGIVEVKHLEKLSWEHYLQAAMYSAMHAYAEGKESTEALLLNLKDGKMERMDPFSTKQLQQLARAKLALKSTVSYNLKINAHRKDCYIAVCVVRNDQNDIVEIGALAFSLAMDVYGTYHRVMSGVTEVCKPEGHRDESTVYCRLSQAGLRVDDSKLLREQVTETGLYRDHFQMWVKHMSKKRTFVYWDNEVRIDLGLPSLTDGSMVNLQEDLRAESGIKSLKDYIVKHFNVNWVYEPHRAFEDAVAVAALFVDFDKDSMKLRLPTTST